MGDFKATDLKATLPNFPEEILEDWLTPYANSEGWPPANGLDSIPRDRWRYLLGGRTLAQLRSIEWQEHNRHLSIHELRDDYKQICVDMVLGAVQKQINLYSSSIPDLSERFNRILGYLREHGTLPKPPVLLSSESGFQVLDGNHRLAAYFYGYGYFKLPLDFVAMDSTASTQRFWVGSI